MRVNVPGSFPEDVTKMIRGDKSGRMIPLIVISIVIVLNSAIIKSPYIGIPSCLIFFYISATATGKLFYFDEKPFLKEALGLVTFMMVMALSGVFLMLTRIFTETVSLIVIVAISLIFYIISMRRRTIDDQTVFNQSKRVNKTAIEPYLLLCSCLFMIGIAFYALVVARTTEGITSVWLTIPNFFLPAFFLSSLLLLFTLFFTKLNVGWKLALISIYSFLVHSLFLLVWYPGRYGDPWFHLGAARFIDSVGQPYAYDWLLKNLYIKDIIMNKTQYALVVLFKRLLCVDIYWVHVAFVPLVWSVFVPLFFYKIADLLSTNSTRKTRTIVDKNKTFPLIAAITTVLFPNLIYWGTISVPNSVGFFFFLLCILFLLYWIKTCRKRIWFLSLLACMTTLVAHPQPGIFALMFLLLVTLIQKSSSSVLKIACYPLMFISYPLALRLANAAFTIEGVLSLENLLTFQSDITSILFAFLLLGLVLSMTGRYVDRRKAVILFVLYLTVIVEYYVTMYGMTDIPYGAGRILALADFAMIPFVALGIWGVTDVLRKAFSLSRTSSLSLPKIKFMHACSPRFVSLLIVSLLLSSQTMFSLYQAYPHDEILDVQPAAYEIDAIYYIISDAHDRFVVLCEPSFATLAVGFLGSDYAYGAREEGLFGVPEWSFWTAQLYLQMCRFPSVSTMSDAISGAGASVSYFVVSVRNPDFEEVVQQTCEILPVDKIFGDGKLYVFKEIRPELVEGIGPSVEVIFDEGLATDYVQTEFKYFYKTDVNYVISSLSGHYSYNITNYPSHWTFQSLVIDDENAKFDESSNVNTFVYVSGLRLDSVLEVAWHANDVYPVVEWKEDAFKSGWQRHPFFFIPKISPDIITDGNVLSLSWDFSTYDEEYQFYYYVKPCNTTTSVDQYIMVRWKSTGPVAVIIVYFKEGEQRIVPFNSQSEDWTLTIAKLEPGREIENIMVGISNLGVRGISGLKTIYIDYVLICSKD